MVDSQVRVGSPAPPSYEGDTSLTALSACLWAPSNLLLVTLLVAWSNTWREAAEGYLVYSVRISVM